MRPEGWDAGGFTAEFLAGYRWKPGKRSSVRFARIEEEHGASYAIVGDGGLKVIAGSPFDTPFRIVREIPVTDARFLVPIVPRNIFCVGRNYRAHAEEMGFPPPERPALFMKPSGTLLASGGTVVLPPPDVSVEVQHEAELVIVVGRTGRDIAPEAAASFILGFTIANDVSARDLQRADSGVIRAKGFDGFCPVGPWIESDVDPDDGLIITCRVNGDVRQRASTTEMIFSARHLVAYLSSFATLHAGDLILTGSPSGSGRMLPGDLIEIQIDGIGTLTHHVAAPR